MEQQQSDKPRRRGLWVKGLLGLSLALNLAVAGMVAGAALRPEGKRFSHANTIGAFGRPYTQALSRADRIALIRSMRRAPDAAIPDKARRRAMAEEVLQSLRATPFDAGALQAAVSRQADAAVAVQQQAQMAWLALVANMSDQERLDYAGRVEDLLKRGPRRQ